MGTTVLVVTHEHELVREFNQRVIAIDKGSVVSDNHRRGYSGYESENFGDEDYSLSYSEYEEDMDLTDDELTDDYSGYAYDDDEPDYPDGVVVVPDDQV